MNGGHVVLDTPGMVYERSFAYFDDVCKKKREARNVEARHKIEALPRGIESKGLQGDKRVERLRYLLENGFVDDQAKRIIRSREQRQLHEVSTPNFCTCLSYTLTRRRCTSDRVCPSSTKMNGKTARSASSTCSALTSCNKKRWS